MVSELTPDYHSQYFAITAVAEKVGIGTAETLRKWARRAAVDAASGRGDVGRACRDQAPDLS